MRAIAKNSPRVARSHAPSDDTGVRDWRRWRTALAVGLVPLVSCTSAAIDPPLANARLEAVRFWPRADGRVYENHPVVASFAYEIDGQATTTPTYFAEIEVATADAGRLFLDACGRDARRRLDATRGRLQLECRMHLPQPGESTGPVEIAVRLYQETAPGRRVMIAAARSGNLTVEKPPIARWELATFRKCPRDGGETAGGRVLVCRT